MKTLKFGGVPSEECEVVIRLDKVDKKAYVCSTWAEWSRKLTRMHGDPSKYSERDGMVYVCSWILPINTISVRKGKREMSPEAKKAASDRMRNARSLSVRQSADGDFPSKAENG